MQEFEGIKSYKENFKKLHSSIARFSDPEVNIIRKIEYLSKTGKHMHHTVSEILLTLVNHGTYHRGNISTMLRQVGAASVSMDYAFYLRDLRDAREE